MPVLRSEVQSFVQTWNVHRIRKQRHRPHVVHGKPFINYYYPQNGIHDYGFPANEETLNALGGAVQNWGEYSLVLTI